MNEQLCLPVLPGPLPRRETRQARIVWGDNIVTIGGGAPVRVQSMTNTDTVDAIGTAIQVKELARAGSEIVRITVNTPEAAAAVPHIREQLDRMGVNVPLVGDFHYNGHKLLQDYPACAEALSKYRINPGNVGQGAKRDTQFAQMIEMACRYSKPVRIGVNWGSLDQDLLARIMDENAGRAGLAGAERDDRGADHLGDRLGEEGRGNRPAGQPDHPVVQGVAGAGADRGVPRAGAPLRLCAASRPDRGGHGQQGHRGVDGGAVGAAAGRHR